MSVLTLKRSDVRDVLQGTNGKFFTVTFIKRTSGEKRKMNASLNYKGLLKGGDATYDAKSKGLLIVRDCTKQAIRSIPLDAVLEISANGNTYQVVD